MLFVLCFYSLLPLFFKREGTTSDLHVVVRELVLYNFNSPATPWLPPLCKKEGVTTTH